MSNRGRNPLLDADVVPANRAHGGALLQIWLSPSFPTGAFAYSHGLEKVVEHGWIKDRATLQDWLIDLIEHGSLRNDLILLSASWRAVTTGELPDLPSVAALAAAYQPSAERYLEATQQGRSFVTQIETAWPMPGLDFQQASRGATPTLAVALGYTAAMHGLDLSETLRAYAVGFIGNLTSAAIRLSVIGQTDAQRVTSALLERLLSAADAASDSTLDDLGSATWRADLASLQHETQHTRLFRS